MKALVKVGYACNDHCTFCHTQDVRHIDDTEASVHAKIERARVLGHSMVVFSGGEPTIRKEIGAWAAHVARLGMKLGFVTNGRRFAYPEFTEAMLRNELSYVYLSLHGADAKIHNSLVRADAFEESFGGVKALHGRIPVLTVNCVVARSNVRHLRKLVELLVPFPELTVKLSMTAPKGGGDRSFDHVVAPVAEVADAVADAIRHGIALRGDARGPAFAHDGIPLCLMPGLEHLYDDLRTNDFRTMSEVGEPDFFPVDDVIKLQPAPCEACALRGPCPGLFRGYVERFPDEVALLRPRAGARSNSCNFVPTRDIARPPGAPCPVKHDGTTSYDRGRSLFLRLRDRMRLYETRTRDFADSELLAMKEDLGQLYVDVSSKLSPDDFARDLRKLDLLAECRACEARPHCTGCWAPTREDVFTRDDARVHGLLRSLRGDVLDVGAGEGRYLGSLADAAGRDELRYEAIEPDAEAARTLAARHAWARFRVEKAEAAKLPPAAFDHVLVLRSYNHLVMPEQVFPKLLAALRPGGSLVVVDNVAFGLLRAKEHAARAERGPAALEHARNDDAARAHAVITAACREDAPSGPRFGLALVERADIDRTTSNQWLLRYEKRAAR